MKIVLHTICWNTVDVLATPHSPSKLRHPDQAGIWLAGTSLSERQPGRLVSPTRTLAGSPLTVAGQRWVRTIFPTNLLNTSVPKTLDIDQKRFVLSTCEEKELGEIIFILKRSEVSQFAFRCAVLVPNEQEMKN